MFIHSKVGFEFENRSEPTTSYFVCSTPRCGSSLICEALLNSKLAGAPTEYFDVNIQARFYEHWDINSFDAYLGRLLKTKTGPNGVFGSKAHFNQFNRCFGVDKLPVCFPNLHFIWVSRNNLVEQAVSYALAIQTDQWSAAVPGNGAQPIYDQDQIASLIQRLKNEQSKWVDFFQRHSITPLEMVYEDFSQALASSVIECLKFMNISIPQPLSLEPLTLRKQANELSREWLERFRRETGH